MREVNGKILVFYVCARILHARQSDLSGLGGADNKKKQKLSQSAAGEDTLANDKKRLAIMSEITYEATLFGLWFVNLAYIASFLFMSFIVLRFSSTGLNYYGSTIGTVFLTQWLVSVFANYNSQ